MSAEIVAFPVRVGQTDAVPTELIPVFQEGFEGFDTETAANMRDWLYKVLEGSGATVIGWSLHSNSVELLITLEGYDYNISIRPTFR